MGIFVDDINNLGVLDVLEILQCLFVGLFAEVMHDNHFEVVLLVSEVYEVLDPAVRLHDQVDQFFIYYM